MFIWGLFLASAFLLILLNVRFRKFYAKMNALPLDKMENDAINASLRAVAHKALQFGVAFLALIVASCCTLYLLFKELCVPSWGNVFLIGIYALLHVGSYILPIVNSVRASSGMSDR